MYFPLLKASIIYSVHYNWRKMVDTNIEVSLECEQAYIRLKLNKDLKFIVFKIVKQPEEVVVVDRVGALSVTHEEFVATLPPNEPRLAVIDHSYKNDDGLDLNKIIFIHWNPDNSPVKLKMIYAGSKGNLRRRFEGIGRELQAGSPDEVSLASLNYAANH